MLKLTRSTIAACAVAAAFQMTGVYAGDRTPPADLRLAQQAIGKPPAPSAEKGSDIARKLCATCHLTGADVNDVAKVGPPTFSALANKPGQTAAHITSVLIQPHPQMPDMQLTNGEIADILAYLQTLRRSNDNPLSPPADGSKPKIPAPT